MIVLIYIQKKKQKKKKKIESKSDEKKPPKTTEICKFYLKGKCKFGEKCKKIHQKIEE